MSDMTKILLEQLYANEIKAAKGTISNERCFMKGCYDADEILMHQENIEQLQDYLETLEELKAGVE